MNKYLKEYKWKDIRQMRRNNKADPKECNNEFKGKTVLITGATNGIGYCTAKEYASHGSNLILVNRNEERSRKVCEEIKEEFGVKCDDMIADFSRLSDVRKLGEDLVNSDLDIDIYIYNAGVYSTTKQFTEDDIELVFQVNFLASFILNYMLMDKIKSENKARIIFVNSEGHRFKIAGIRLEDLRWDHHHYSGLRSYGNSKTAQLLTLIKFAEFYKDSNVTINAMHPGNVKSNMGNNNGKLYRLMRRKLVLPSARPTETSATALYYLGVSDEVSGINGKFFNYTNLEKPAPHARDVDIVDDLWNLSLKLGGLK